MSVSGKKKKFYNQSFYRQKDPEEPDTAKTGKLDNYVQREQIKKGLLFECVFCKLIRNSQVMMAVHVVNEHTVELGWLKRLLPDLFFNIHEIKHVLMGKLHERQNSHDSTRDFEWILKVIEDHGG